MQGGRPRSQTACRPWPRHPNRAPGPQRGADGWMDGWMGGWMDGWMDGWMGGWMDGWMDGWMGGWMRGVGVYLYRQFLGLGFQMDQTEVNRSYHARIHALAPSSHTLASTSPPPDRSYHSPPTPDRLWQVACNASGTMVSVLVSSKEKSADTKMFVFCSETNSTVVYDFANDHRMPQTMVWDVTEPRLLAVQVWGLSLIHISEPTRRS
eukprot:363793-Chlamydomonas_euryale.AAC.10